MTVIRNKATLVANYRARLNENVSDCLDGLMIVFGNQVEDEVATASTHYMNRRGFNKSDAKALTQIAKDRLQGKELDEQQIAQVKRRIPKYAWQIVTSKIGRGDFVKSNGVYSGF